MNGNQHIDQSIEINWAALGAIALVGVLLAALIVWMFSGKGRDR